MPYINLKSTLPMDGAKQETIKQRLGTAITLISGKTEAALMVSIEPNQALWLSGKKLENGAFADVAYFGEAPEAELDAFNQELFRILKEELGTPPEAVYATYQTKVHWGAGGNCGHWKPA